MNMQKGIIRRAAQLKWLSLVLLFAPVQISRAQSVDQVPPRNRIASPVDNAETSIIKGNVHPLARAEFDRGEADSSLKLQGMTMMFRPTAAQQAALDALLTSQQDRSSPNYHRWLTSEQFANASGISQNDLNKIVSWLQGHGFQVTAIANSRTWISFSGSAQQVKAAFRTPMHVYVVNGETHHANSAEPSVPSAFGDVIMGFRGLNDFHPKARARVRAVAKPDFTSSVSALHFITPSDFAVLYDLNPLYSAGINGTGQKIAVMGQTDIAMSDIATFRSLAGLTANPPQIVLPAGDPGTSSGDVSEAALDLEWSGAVAPNATIYYVNSTDAFSSMMYAIDQNTAPVVSISYGLCELELSTSEVTSIAQTAQEANAKGITIVAPSGDSGAADCDGGYPATEGLAVDFPASLPYVTGVGGTEFNEGTGTYWNTTNNPCPNGGSAISYIPEVVWNGTPPPASCTGLNSGCELSAAGGGASILNTLLPGQFPKPVWQQAFGVPADGVRDVPDLSIDASPDHDGYLICSSGSCVVGWRATVNGNLNVIGGTSMGVPTFAGIVALINQQAGTPQGQGNINYILYPLAASDPSAFHPIVSGNNIVPCLSGSPGCPSTGPNAGEIGYSATAGYDLASGLGSIDAYNLVTAWTSVSSSSSLSSSNSSADFQLVASPPNLTVSPNGSVTAQLTLMSMNGFTVTGTPNFTCTVATNLTGVTCSVAAASSPNTWTLSVQAAATAGGNRPASFVGIDGQLAGGLIMTSLLVLFVIAARSHKKHQLGRTAGSQTAGPARWNLAGGFAVLLLAAFAAGCGSSSKSSGSGATGSGSTTTTTAASATVRVQGTANGISHTVQLNVTVN